MKTIINRPKDKDAKDLAKIYGVTARAVRYRVNKIRRKAYVLNGMIFTGKISSEKAQALLTEFHNKWLPGYNYEVSGDEARPHQYTFYKNV